MTNAATGSLDERNSSGIELLMLADWAEAINGKLYVMGGGFTTVAVRDLDRPLRFAVAAILVFPPEGAVRTPFSAHIEDGHGRHLGEWALSGELDLPPDAENRGSLVIAGPAYVPPPPPDRVVLNMRFGNAERTVGFDVVDAD